MIATTKSTTKSAPSSSSSSSSLPLLSTNLVKDDDVVKDSIQESLKMTGLENDDDETYDLVDNMQSPKSFVSVESLREGKNIHVDGFFSASEDDEDEEEEDESEAEEFEPSYGGPWQHEIDRHGRSYVFNRLTGESRWLEDNESMTSPPGDPPSTFLSPLFSEASPRLQNEDYKHAQTSITPIQTKQKSESMWTPCTDENGYTYYFNQLTGVSRWSLPGHDDENTGEEGVDDVIVSQKQVEKVAEAQQQSAVDLSEFIQELEVSERTLSDICIDIRKGTDDSEDVIPKTPPPSAITARAQAEIARLIEELRLTKERHNEEVEDFKNQIRDANHQHEKDQSRLKNLIDERDKEILSMRGEMVMMELREKNLKNSLRQRDENITPFFVRENDDSNSKTEMTSSSTWKNHDDGSKIEVNDKEGETPVSQKDEKHHDEAPPPPFFNDI